MKFLNREIIFIDENWEKQTTYFRGADFYSILPYFEKFKDSIKDVVQINRPDDDDEE